RHWRDPWWRFVLFGAAVSIIPGALTADQFHSLRLVAYPIFLLVLTIPALAWLFERVSNETSTEDSALGRSSSFPISSRRAVLLILLAAVAAQTIYFQRVFRRDGPERGWV